MSSSMFTAMPTPSSLLSAYASITTSIMLFRTMFDQLFPPQIRRYIVNFFRFYWKPKSSKLTLVFEEDNGMTIDHMFAASETYLCTKIGPDSKRLRVTKDFKEKDINIKFAETEEVADSFKGIPVMWKFVRLQIPEEKHRGGSLYDSDDDSECAINTKSSATYDERKYIELIFDKQYKETIISTYLPWILKYHEEIQNKKKVVKLYKLHAFGRGCSIQKHSVNLDHPSTFDTLAIDPGIKKGIVDDLDLFLSRKDYYKRVGKAWKRGYLLYGPPGTGKSSLIAAIANYLKFDIYDLQLSNVMDDYSLTELLLKTSNRSILVIEDIDCSTKLPDRDGKVPSKSHGSDGPQFSLSGLLNFIDGLWSSCGDERIIIFTTNHKDKLDPALLRPGRMDKHIHMSYLTVGGFTTLAANYLNIHGDHWRFKEIKELISCKKVTPAEVAEQLMTSDDVEVALEGLVTFLKLKKMEEDETNIPPHETEE